MVQITTLCILLVLILFSVSIAFAATPQLAMNLESGFYRSPISLHISCNDKRATVYYTLDGTKPDENSLVYSRPLVLTASNERKDVLTHMSGIAGDDDYLPEKDFPTGHVVRAVAISDVGIVSEEVSGTYFIGYDRKELYGDTSIMLLVMDPEDLFDYENGIYVRGRIFEEWAAQQTEEYESWQVTANYTQRGREWERPVAVTYLPADGQGFTQNMGLRIKGNVSRNHAQKSLRLIAREDYGLKNIKYKLFSDNIRELDGRIVEKYKSFTLRNGGSDCNYAKIRDPYISDLADGLHMVTAQNMPCIAFINGEYWGVYTLTEEFSKNFFQYHYGVDDDYAILVKNGKLEDGLEEDIHLFRDAYDFVVENDMSDQAKYEEACELFDMDSLADYCAVHLYIANEDGPFENNNWQLWRFREVDSSIHRLADGKWRTVLFDTDYSSGIYNNGNSGNIDNISSIFMPPQIEWRNFPMLVHKLLNNAEFRKKVVMACCDVRNLYFAKNRAEELLKEMKKQYLPYVPDSLRRFGPEQVLHEPEQRVERKIDSIGLFFNTRYDCFTEIVGNAFGLNEACRLTIEVSGSGNVYVNGRNIAVTQGETLEYFPEYRITLKAAASRGFRFEGWEIIEGEAKLSSVRMGKMDMEFVTPEVTLRAVFK